jgi:predicted DNA-binding transcriptional regulator AlpA
MKIETNRTSERSSAGWNIPDWCSATTIARATFYTLEHRPRTVKIGRRTVVIESPTNYLERIAQAQLEAA